MCRVFILEKFMLNLAAKLKGFHKNSSTKSSSAIFGEVSPGSSLSTSERPRLRIGLWPIQSESDPLIAMGLGTLLGFLLERWPSVQVYRLPAQVEADPQNYNWTEEKSQFGVDDWELDGLDENAAMWGAFQQNQSYYILTLEIENDLADDESKVQTWKSESLTELVNLLPRIAETITAYLGAGDIDSINPIYQSGGWNEDGLKNILKASFDWELNLFLNLWGKTWENEQILDDYRKLSTLGKTLNNGLGDWIVSKAAARVLSPLYPFLDSNTPLLEYVEKASLEPTTGLIYRHTIALALYRAGYPVRAFDLLELNVEQFPDSLVSWLTLGELYWQNGEIGTALNSIQRAIKVGAVSELMYIRYAEMLLTLDASNLVINIGAQRASSTGRVFSEDFILINTDETRENRLIHEAIKAYHAAVQLEPNNVETLSHLLIQLVDLQEPTLWSQFEKLVELDHEGAYVRNVIEAMASFEDIEPSVKILSVFVGKHPNQVQAHLSLASAYILNEQNDKARAELEIAQKLSDSKQINSEIERLLLSADDPDFDGHLAEITDLLNAGNKITPEDVEFLEATVENAPTFATGYILLANAYLKWDEITDALDTLLDGQRQLPDDPDISVLLARVLWREGETQLAFDYLNKSLAKNPNHVPTLTLIGCFLFEDGQEDEARSFLVRAEAIAPRDISLRDARIYIAKAISDSNSD
jgi:cytochrome c-type biogenesis protein CcmH/NrfG